MFRKELRGKQTRAGEAELRDRPSTEQLQQQHSHEAISRRIHSATQHSYLGDFVLGAVDGAVTTFAIVAGSAGAGFGNTVAAVLGLANVVADGFSMAASNYLKARADAQVVERFRRLEEMHIDRIPDGEREEIRQIFSSKGFSGDLLDQVVEVITDNRRRWVDTMLTEEWGLQLETPHPGRAATATFTAFLLVGLVPLVPLLVPGLLPAQSVFVASACLTALTFLTVGWINGLINSRSTWRSALETLGVGGAAAALAYFAGVWLRSLVGD